MSKLFLPFCLFLLVLMACDRPAVVHLQEPRPKLIVLGVAQDAGYPQAGCTKSCCAHHYHKGVAGRSVSCLGLSDPVSGKLWMFDATPDFREQWRTLQKFNPKLYQPDGIFLTHAHIGHYTGLMQLGREVMNTNRVQVYTMSRMAEYLSLNGPWSQLVELNNIEINRMREDSSVALDNGIHVTPLLVPHRDEFSETVGFVIASDRKRILFIPDIDKWDRWDRSIEKVLAGVDIAFVDGTFFKNGELKNRDMSQIPHPFIQESMEHLSHLPDSEKSKVYFTHFNHTNPLLWDEESRKVIESKGFGYAYEGQEIEL